jgi:PUA-domain protein
MTTLRIELGLMKLGRFLRKDDIKGLRAKVQTASRLGEILLPHGCKVEGFSVKGGEVFAVNNEPVFFAGSDGIIIPLLVYVLKSSLPLPLVTVDMNAVPHICNGADVFRGGVRNIDPDVKLDEIVVVVDEKNLKPICVGTSLMEAKAMREASGGKVIRNRHYVGDDLWNFSRGLDKHMP